jgi:hypothetical protein
MPPLRDASCRESAVEDGTGIGAEDVKGHTQRFGSVEELL